METNHKAMEGLRNQYFYYKLALFKTVRKLVELRKTTMSFAVINTTYTA